MSWKEKALLSYTLCVICVLHILRSDPKVRYLTPLCFGFLILKRRKVTLSSQGYWSNLMEYQNVDSSAVFYSEVYLGSHSNSVTYFCSFFIPLNLSLHIFKCSDNIDLEKLYMLAVKHCHSRHSPSVTISMNITYTNNRKGRDDYFWLVAEELMVIIIFSSDSYFLLF